MDGIFYKIIYNDRTYIGELSSSTDSKLDFFKFHVKPAEPWEPTRGVVRWEHNLQEALNKNGLKQELENFTFLGFMSFSEGVDYIIGTMQTFINWYRAEMNNLYANGQEWYDDVVSSFGLISKDKDIKVPEMLLILLEGKKGTLWNTHANYGSVEGNIGAGSYKEIIKESVLQKRANAAGGNISIWFTYDPKKVGDQILDAVAKRVNSTGTIAFDVNNTKNRQNLMPTLNHAISDLTIKSLRAQFDNYIKTLSSNADPEHRNIAATLEFIKRDLVGDDSGIKGKFEPTGTGKKQLRTFLTELNKQIDKKINRNFFYTPPDLLKQKVYWLQRWIEEVNAPTYPSNFTPNLNWYKKDFTNHIQETYFNRPEIPEYNNWRDDWTENRTSTHPLRPGALYPTFLKKQSPDTKVDNTDLKQKIRSKIKEEEEFVKNNWDYIYPEQIAYCLTKKDANFESSDEIETYDGFINTIELEKIQHY